MSRKRRKNHTKNAIPNTVPQKATPSSARGFRFQASTLAGLSLLLAAATFLLYLPIAHHPFINYDDEIYIFENPEIQAGLNFATVKWAATSLHAANWHPLTWLVHVVDFQVYGLDAGGHHLTSLLLHVANAVLLFLMLAFATRASGRSFFAAALFALHPLNVESVAWAAELKNVLCTFFFFLTIAAYIWYARKPGISRYALVFLLFALGLAAKPMVITLPFVLLLLDFWPLSRVHDSGEPFRTLQPPQGSAMNLGLEKLPLFALSAASAWITIRAQTAGQATTMINASLGLRMANAIVAYAKYIEKTLLPANLAPFYPFPAHGIALWQILVSVVVLLVISVVVVRFGRHHGYLVTGWLWFLGTLVPVIGIFQVGAQARADRYAYIPIIGLLLMLVWGVFEIAETREWSFALRTAPPMLLLTIFFALSSRQISYWGSSYSLWTHTIAVTKDNAPAEHNLSSELMRSGRMQEASPHLQRAVELDPSDLVSRMDLGALYLSQGRQREALHELLTVVEKSGDPKLQAAAFVNAGGSYLKLGDPTNAEAAYRSALHIAPGNTAALLGLQAVELARRSPSTPQR